MKKISILTIAAMLASGAASAEMIESETMTVYVNNVPYSVMEIEDIKTLNDNSMVVGRGYITKHMGDETYVFQDRTGTMMVEIDDEVWNGQYITPTDMVLISGEVDRDGNEITIEIDGIQKM